jgi:hypothetical protein
MVHPFHIIKEICLDHQIDVTLMHGSNFEHVSFFMKREPYNTKIYGLCNGAKVTFDVKNRLEYDLADPDSISQMSEYLSSRIWQ